MSPSNVALVTGAGKRVGAAIARALAARGYRVAVHYNSSGEEAERLVAELGHGAQSFRADLSDPASPERLVSEVVRALGPIDVLINSASNFLRLPLESVTAAQWDEVFAVNLRAPFFLCLAASRHMGPAGCIVNMADLAAFETWPAFIPHGIAKAGVVQMTRALARQLAPRIRVNAIAPGVVLPPDDMSREALDRMEGTTPLRRHGDPSDVVHAVEYLLDATFVTGDVLFVDGGRHARY
ncbi:MAG: SDR family oxidoreductase [Gemmatimonadaceae bacterium]